MASDVEIASAALMKLGYPPIQSFIDDSDSAVAINAIYAICRDDVLSAHDWNFATKRAQLAKLATAPLTNEFTNNYTLPSDCIRVSYIEPNGYRFAVENGKILTDAGAPIKIAYIARITDASLFSANFVGALVYRLDMELCTALTARDGYQRDFSSLYAAKLQEAKGTDGLEGTGVIEDFNVLGFVRRFNNTDGPDHSGWPWW